MDLALNNLQWLMCHKTKPNQTNLSDSNTVQLLANKWTLILLKTNLPKKYLPTNYRCLLTAFSIKLQTRVDPLLNQIT